MLLCCEIYNTCKCNAFEYNSQKMWVENKLYWSNVVPPVNKSNPQRKMVTRDIKRESSITMYHTLLFSQVN